MIPHKSKLFQCILNFSFTLFHKGVTYSSVNDKTRKMSRPESMAQLDLFIKRIIYTMALHWHHGLPFKFTKLDIKDRFLRMELTNKDAWNFCYVLSSLQPKQALNEVDMVVPNSLQMRWWESPPFFYSRLETARYIMEKVRLIDLSPHKFENIMMQYTNVEDINQQNNSLLPSHISISSRSSNALLLKGGGFPREESIGSEAK